jgi:hypothetical protein
MNTQTTWPQTLFMNAALIAEFAACEEGAHEDGEQAEEYGISAYDLLHRHKATIEVRNLKEAELIYYAADSGTFALYSRTSAQRVMRWLDPLIDPPAERKAATMAPMAAAKPVAITPSKAPAYDPVNDIWAGLATVPRFTSAEALRAAKALYVRFGKRADGGPKMVMDMLAPGTVRRCWIQAKPGKPELRRGLPRLLHDVAHRIFRKRHPGWRPHHPQHARLELEIVQHAITAGWHTGALAPKAKAKPTPAARADARLASARKRLATWEAKARRATRAAAKLKRQIRAAERRQAKVAVVGSAAHTPAQAAP